MQGIEPSPAVQVNATPDRRTNAEKFNTNRVVVGRRLTAAMFLVLVAVAMLVCFPVILAVQPGSALGIGLLLSTLTRNQFNAAQAALNIAFLPATLLSGLIFEIASMPVAIQIVTMIVPARYFVTVMQTLFQAGDIAAILLPNLLFLLISAMAWLGITAVKMRRRLDG